MRIIFDSEEQKEKFLKDMQTGVSCPGSYGLNRPDFRCSEMYCSYCWSKAMECEVKESKDGSK